MEKVTVTSHCVDDSRGEYVPKVVVEKDGCKVPEVFIGEAAVEFIRGLMSRYDSPDLEVWVR